MYFNKNIEVRDSEIHGFGIFTNSFIPKGSVIMIIEGEVIDEAECIRRENEENNVYIFWNENSYIDTIKTDKIKYINHDCDYNCEVADRDENSLLLVASRDILYHEELTIDYGYEEIYDYCSCNTCAQSQKMV